MLSMSSTYFRLPAAGLAVVFAAILPGRHATTSASVERSLSPVGTYTLRTVNGKHVPAVMMQNEQFKAEILSGSTTLKANYTYTVAMVTRTTMDGQRSISRDGHHGTYKIAGSTLTIHSTKGDVLTGTIKGNTITTLPEHKDPKMNFIFVFSK